MSNKVKVPGGAFYLGDGLTVDPITRTVSAGGGDVTTPDWNQNDATASDYVKNRPFYETDPVETVMLPETTVTIAVGKTNIISESFPYSFEIGKTYTIIFDGVETEYTAYDGGSGAGYVGYDPQSVSGGIGYFIASDGGVAALVTRDASLAGQHTISVKSKMTEIVKIEEKYLPKYTEILPWYFWEVYSQDRLISICEEFANGKIFAVKNDQSNNVTSLLLYSFYDKNAGFNFVYTTNHDMKWVHGGPDNWTESTSVITWS